MDDKGNFLPFIKKGRCLKLYFSAKSSPTPGIFVKADVAASHTGLLWFSQLPNYINLTFRNIAWENHYDKPRIFRTAQHHSNKGVYFIFSVWLTFKRDSFQQEINKMHNLSIGIQRKQPIQQKKTGSLVSWNKTTALFLDYK